MEKRVHIISKIPLPGKRQLGADILYGTERNIQQYIQRQEENYQQNCSHRVIPPLCLFHQYSTSLFLSHELMGQVISIIIIKVTIPIADAYPAFSSLKYSWEI